MVYYTLIDTVTGEQKVLVEDWLTRNLRLNCIILRGDEHLGIVTHRDLVLFARWCAYETNAQLMVAPDQRVTYALSLVDRWLEDEKSVTSEELEIAADAAWDAAQDASLIAAQATEGEFAAEGFWSAAAQAAWAAWAAASASEASNLITEIVFASSDTYILLKSQTRWFLELIQTGK